MASGCRDDDDRHHARGDVITESKTTFAGRGPSLLDLPVEVLASIFRRLNSAGRATSGGPPASCLLLCRTLNPLVRALRLERIHLPCDPASTQRALGTLLKRLPRDRSRFEGALELRLGIDIDEPAADLVLGVVVAQFTSLRTLTVSIESYGVTPCDLLLDVLVDLPHLRTLDLDIPDTSAWFTNEPPLRRPQDPIDRVRLDAHKLNNVALSHFLKDVHPRDLTLRIGADTVSLADLPWASIETLTLEFTSNLKNPTPVMLAKIAKQLAAASSNRLRHLVVDIITDFLDLMIHLPLVRTTFEHCALETIKVHSSTHEFDISEHTWVWPTLKSLELAMPPSHLDFPHRPKLVKHTMSTLYSAILEMPHLSHLALVNVSFRECDCCTPYSSVDAILAHRDDPAAFPALVTFVGLLRARTGVLDFRLRSSVGQVALGAGREARWTRRSVEDDFRLQGWTLE